MRINNFLIFILAGSFFSTVTHAIPSSADTVIKQLILNHQKFKDDFETIYKSSKDQTVFNKIEVSEASHDKCAKLNGAYSMSGTTLNVRYSLEDKVVKDLYYYTPGKPEELSSCE